jgi:hypothetical protein
VLLALMLAATASLLAATTASAASIADHRRHGAVVFSCVHHSHNAVLVI